MEKQKSLEFLDKCIEEMQSLSQEEFDQKIKEIGLDKFTYDLTDYDSDFKIILDPSSYMGEGYDYSPGESVFSSPTEQDKTFDMAIDYLLESKNNPCESTQVENNFKVDIEWIPQVA